MGLGDFLFKEKEEKYLKQIENLQNKLKQQEEEILQLKYDLEIVTQERDNRISGKQLEIFERNLKQILELYGIKPKGKGTGQGQGNQGSIIDKLLDSIEKQKGALPTTSNSLKDIVTNDLRHLRNHCIHDAVHDAVKAQTDIDSVINKNPALSFLDGELHIKDIQVLLNYLNASKEFLEIIEEHCRNNP